jgi:hypothetical protein
MRKSKRIIALVTALIFLLSLAAVPAFAKADYSDAIKKITAVGAMVGFPDGSFRENDTFTRAQAATVMARISGYEPNQAALTKSGFTDVPNTHWSSDAVAWAVKAGVVKGYPDGTFKPDGQVTYREMVAMLIRVLGYGPQVEAGLGWPLGYDVKGAELGLISPVYAANPNAAAIRGEVALATARAVYDATAKDGTKIIHTVYKQPDPAVVEAAKKALEAAQKAVAAYEAAPLTTLAQVAAAEALEKAANDANAKVTDAAQKAALAAKVAAQKAKVDAAKVALAPLVVESVTALNAKQVLVVFNKAVDRTTAQTAGNYVINGTAAAEATRQADQKSVLVNLNPANILTNQSINNTVVVQNVRDTATPAYTMITQTLANIAMTDSTLPTLQSAAMISPTQLRVVFSEPVRRALGAEASTQPAATYFQVDNGVFPFVGANVTVDHTRNAIVATFANPLPQGAYTLRVIASSLQDYVSLPVQQKDITFNYAPDTTAPTFSVVEASPVTITIEFNKAVSNVNLATIHAGFQTVTAVATPVGGAPATRWNLDFSANPILAPSTTLVVNNNTVSPIVDGWNNQYVNTSVTVNIAVDTTKPAITSSTVVNNSTVRLNFNKPLRNGDGSNGAADRAANYVLQNAAGTVITSATAGFAGIVDANGSPLAAPAYDNDNRRVTVTFGGNLPAGSYRLAVAGVQDQTTYNRNTMDAQVITFEITTALAISSAIIDGVNTRILVSFNKAMSTGDGSFVNPLNYKLVVVPSGPLVDLPAGTTIVAQGSNSALITFPTAPANLGAGDILYAPGVRSAGGEALGITAVGRVLDADSAVAAADIRNIRLVNPNTVTFEVAKPLSNVNAANFRIAGNAPVAANYVNQVLADGTTFGALVTITTVANHLSTNVAANQIALATARDTGVTFSDNTGAMTTQLGTLTGALVDLYNAGANTVRDAAAPTILSRTTVDSNSNNRIDGIQIVFSEPVRIADVNTATFTVDGYTVTSVTPNLATRTSPATGTKTATDTFILNVTEKTVSDTGATPLVRLMAAVRDASTAGNAIQPEANGTAAVDTAAPFILATSTLANVGTAGTIENGDRIVLNFNEIMNAASIGTSFNISVSNAAASVITIDRTASGNVATITTTARQYNTHATTAMTFNGSTGVWSNNNQTLTITLANLTGGTAAIGVTDNTISIAAGAQAVDLAGNAANTTAVTGASSRF